MQPGSRFRIAEREAEPAGRLIAIRHDYIGQITRNNRLLPCPNAVVEMEVISKRSPKHGSTAACPASWTGTSNFSATNLKRSFPQKAT